MKFSSDLAEQLYGETPDEQSGSVDELGWFGLFKQERTILTEDCLLYTSDAADE